MPELCLCTSGEHTSNRFDNFPEDPRPGGDYFRLGSLCVGFPCRYPSFDSGRCRSSQRREVVPAAHNHHKDRLSCCWLRLGTHRDCRRSWQFSFAWTNCGAVPRRGVGDHGVRLRLPFRSSRCREQSRSSLFFEHSGRIERNIRTKLTRSWLQLAGTKAARKRKPSEYSRDFWMNRLYTRETCGSPGSSCGE
jgi:hypothetical protein